MQSHEELFSQDFLSLHISAAIISKYTSKLINIRRSNSKGQKEFSTTQKDSQKELSWFKTRLTNIEEAIKSTQPTKPDQFFVWQGALEKYLDEELCNNDTKFVLAILNILASSLHELKKFREENLDISGQLFSNFVRDFYVGIIDHFQMKIAEVDRTKQPFSPTSPNDISQIMQRFTHIQEGISETVPNRNPPSGTNIGDNQELKEECFLFQIVFLYYYLASRTTEVILNVPSATRSHLHQLLQLLKEFDSRKDLSRDFQLTLAAVNRGTANICNAAAREGETKKKRAF